MSERGDAQIVARGFQRYDGPRSGVPGAVRSVSWQSIRATLGLGRPARSKIFPVIAVVIAYVPAIVFVGIAVLIPGDILEPEEVAGLVAYLCSDGAATVTGAAWPMDLGWTAR